MCTVPLGPSRQQPASKVRQGPVPSSQGHKKQRTWMFPCSGNGTKHRVQADSGVARSAVQVVAGVSLACWEGVGTELGTGFQAGLFYLPFLQAGTDLCELWAVPYVHCSVTGSLPLGLVQDSEPDTPAATVALKNAD